MTTSVAPYWDIFAPPVLDNSTTQYEYLEYLDNRSNITLQTYYDIVSQDLDQFMYPSNSYIQVGVNVTDTNNNPIYQGQIALTNGGFNLFDRAQYLINDYLVEDVEFPGLVTQVTGLVNDSRSYGETSISEMWAPDTGDGIIIGNSRIAALHMQANNTAESSHIVFDSSGYLVKSGGVFTAGTNATVSIGFPQPLGAALPLAPNGELAANFYFYQHSSVPTGLAGPPAPSPGILTPIPLTMHGATAYASTDGNGPSHYFGFVTPLADTTDYSGREVFLYLGDPASAALNSPYSTLRKLDSYTFCGSQFAQYPIRYFLGPRVIYPSQNLPGPPAQTGYIYYITATSDYLPGITQARLPFTSGTPQPSWPVNPTYMDCFIAAAFSNPVTDGATSLPTINKGFIARRNALYNPSSGAYDREVMLYLPITRVFKLFEKNRRAFRGMKHTIRLYKNKKYNGNNLVMKTQDTPQAVVNINKISWWIPTVKPNDAVLLDINTQCNSGASTQLFWGALNCINGDPLLLTTAQTNLNWRITSSTRKPLRLYIIFQNQVRYVDPTIGSDTTQALVSQCLNSMIFDKIGVTSAYVRVGRNQYPMIQYGPINFNQGATEDISRLFNTYLQMSNTIFDKKHNDINTKLNSGITYDEFQRLYPMLCFDMSSQEDGIWTNNTEIDIQLFATLDGTAAGTFFPYAIIEYQHSVTIQGANNRLTLVM